MTARPRGSISYARSSSIAGRRPGPGRADPDRRARSPHDQRRGRHTRCSTMPPCACRAFRLPHGRTPSSVSSGCCARNRRHDRQGPMKHGVSLRGSVSSVAGMWGSRRLCASRISATRFAPATSTPRRWRCCRRGSPTILEDGLEELLREELAPGGSRSSSELPRQRRSSEFVFLCVPTPQLADGSADTSTLEQRGRPRSPR